MFSVILPCVGILPTRNDGTASWNIAETNMASARQSYATSSGRIGAMELLCRRIFCMATMSCGAMLCCLQSTSTCDDRLPKPCRVFFNPSWQAMTSVSCMMSACASEGAERMSAMRVKSSCAIVKKPSL